MRWSVVVAVLVACLASGCDILVEKQRSAPAVATYVAPGSNPAAYRTFAMVGKLGNVQPGAFATPLDSPALLERIRAELEARGYSQVATVDPSATLPTVVNADLAVNVTALGEAGTAPDLWLSSPGHATPAAWGHPGQWAYSWTWVPIQPKATSMLIEIGDLRAAADVLPVVWSTVAYSVGGVESYDTPAALEAVDVAFQQTPALHAGEAP